MRGLVVVLAMLLCGCEAYNARNEEKAFEIWDKNTTSSSAERCGRMLHVADAWAKAGNAAKFNEWKSRSSWSCFRMKIDPEH